MRSLLCCRHQTELLCGSKQASCSLCERSGIRISPSESLTDPSCKMTDYHTTYRRGEGESTQWEDIQRRLGNFKPVEKPWQPDAFRPVDESADRRDREWLDAQVGYRERHLCSLLHTFRLTST